jgi:hypothetical protein
MLVRGRDFVISKMDDNNTNLKVWDVGLFVKFDRFNCTRSTGDSI